MHTFTVVLKQAPIEDCVIEEKGLDSSHTMTAYTQAKAHTQAAIQQLEKEKPDLGELVLPHAKGDKPLQVNVEAGGGSPENCLEAKLDAGKLHVRFNEECLPAHGLDQKVIDSIKQNISRIGFPRSEDLHDTAQLNVLSKSREIAVTKFPINEEVRQAGYRSSGGFYGDYLSKAALSVESWDPSTAPKGRRPEWVQSMELSLEYGDVPKVIPEGLIRVNTKVEGKSVSPSLSINREVYQDLAKNYGLEMAQNAVTLAACYTYIDHGDAMLESHSNYREIAGGISIKPGKK